MDYEKEYTDILSHLDSIRHKMGQIAWTKIPTESFKDYENLYKEIKCFLENEE